MVRLVSLLVAVPLVALGAFGLAAPRAPGHAALEPVRGLLAAAAPLAGMQPRALEALAIGFPAPYVLTGVGVLLLVFGLRSRGRAEAVPPPPKKKGGKERAGGGGPVRLSAAAQRKAKRAAKKLARRGELVEAGELCFASGMAEDAIAYFEKAGKLARAAEVCQELRQLDRCAAFYVKAGEPEMAARIHMSQQKWAHAAECYVRAGRLAVAAEMFEKAGNHQRAGECYAESSFHRQAADAFTRAHDWARAARELEAVLAEETTSVAAAGPSPARQRELLNLSLDAARLYEKAGDREGALRVSQRSGWAHDAAKLAEELARHDVASELYEKAGDAGRAASAMRQAGKEQEAARFLAERARDRGDLAQAAEHFEEAGEPLDAADLYRQLERYEDAARCYEAAGDLLQAGEMFRLAGDIVRAAEAFATCGQWSDAAACYEEAQRPVEQAHALARATRYVDAAQIYRREGRKDEALEALQHVDAHSAEHVAACALAGEILLEDGKHALALARLEPVLGDAAPSRDTLGAHYALARALEAAGRHGDAAARYERILAVDLRHRDAEARLAACRAKAVKAAVPSDSAAATRPGRYRVLGELGRGGMGIVYKAHDTVLDRVVALKVLPEALRENEVALQNFLREAKSAAKLNHPNIVTVYDAGEQDGRYYIAMEFVDGTTLKDILKRKGPIAPGGVLNVLLQMCEALGYAHEQRVIHRDVKTANTMWTRDRKAKIMDFGLAKVVEEVRNHTTLVSGTPYYMSPEQTLGKNVDHRTDIYALGVTTFELATGTVPFREGNVPYHHVHTPPPDPRELNPQLPAFLAQIVLRCLQKDPAARFQSTREIAALVKQVVARSAAARSADG